MENNISNFNKMVDKFLDELRKILPNEKDIAIFQSQLGVAQMINKKRVLNEFIKYAYPHKEHIMKKNEEFFLGNEISAKKDFMSESIKLTEMWKTKLSDSNKEVVWKYFQVLIILAEKTIQ